jgi:hypothetical protein
LTPSRNITYDGIEAKIEGLDEKETVIKIKKEINY